MTRIALRVGAPLVAVAALLAGTIVLAHPEPRSVVSAREQPIACAMPESPPIVDPVPVPIVEAPNPTPADDVYARLAVCLRERKVFPQVHVTVDQVRHWVEVEKDPAWREGASWWLPLSGEGQPDYVSGIYISVPDVGTACSGALMN